LKKIELIPYRVYKVDRFSGGYYYIIPKEEKKYKIYLSNKEGVIFSAGSDDKDAPYIDELIENIGLPEILEIDEEAKVRLMINIFHSEDHDSNQG